MSRPVDPRYLMMQSWLSRVLGPVEDLRPASADASFRRYFRARRGRDSYIIMDAPPEKEPVTAFVRIARRLSALGLHVPLILEGDEQAGFLLLTDLGDQAYLDQLPRGNEERLYGDALGALITLQVGGFGDPGFLPAFSPELLRREMELFPEWFLGRHLGQSLDATQRTQLESIFQCLLQAASEQPQVWVHRDYHSRNLMVTGSHNPGILDFQDAVVGPVTYDLVSLLKDAYITWPRARVLEWVRGFHQLALESGTVQDEDPDRFVRAFDLMGVQRHLKVAGIFARLYYRDGKARYLADIPRVLGYIQEVLPLYAELEPLAGLLATHALHVPA
ncbi:MAG TPA: phosphotransferase [Acidiferrobacteraceae bacterium]|nr:phosphotransferase [Acidiferrobacteraceae bacterium]